MNEFALIRQFFTRRADDAAVLVGVGDDAAVCLPEPGQALVTAVDTLVEGVHFPAGPDVDAARHLGFRLVAVNLSDMAAMGANPAWMTLSLTLPTVDADWLHAFSEGLFAAAAQGGVALVGGDTTRGRDIVVSVQMNGQISPDAILTRSGARIGDTLYVSGTLGDAAAGLQQLLAGGPADSTLVERFWRPTPRLALGRALAGVATAAIDVSDGLLDDAGKLLAASGVGGELEASQLPISEALAQAASPAEQCRFALAGGDDYELCFTAAAGLPDRIAGTRITAIGTVVTAPGVTVLDNGRPLTDDFRGYDHFA